jgi:hypothetical protein
MRIGAVLSVTVALTTVAAAPATASEARCPRGLLPLGQNAIAPAIVAALRAVPAEDDPQVTGALFAMHDRQRGPQAKHQCGAVAWRRTVVVYIQRRAYLPAQSASTGVYFVGRFRGGYRVWQIVH